MPRSHRRLNPASISRVGHLDLYSRSIAAPRLSVSHATMRRADTKSDSRRMAASIGSVARSPLLRSLISTSPAFTPFGPTMSWNGRPINPSSRTCRRRARRFVEQYAEPARCSFAYRSLQTDRCPCRRPSN